MSYLRTLATVVLVWFSATTAAASPLVTGNGFGFAVVSPATGTLNKFYAHPYTFARPDERNPLGEGIPTANFIKSLSWNDPGAQDTSAEYVDDSQVIGIHSSAGEGLVFMPFGLRQAALVISWEPNGSTVRGNWSVEWSHAVKSQTVVRMLGIEAQVLKFEDIQESLLLVPLGRNAARQSVSQQYLSHRNAWALISLETDRELQSAIREFNRWQEGSGPKELLKREIAEIERWRVKPPVSASRAKELHLWRQSEIVMRMAQSREPNRPGRYGNGLIVASLPDGLWFMPWVRDMAYATVALARMGHREEARAALLAYFNARPTGKMRAETAGADYQISVVRYFGDGSEEPFFTMEGSTNIEFDNWGLVLWALNEYLKCYDDSALLSVPTYRGRLYESARDYVVKPLITNLEKYDDGLIVTADTSIWEERQKDKKHFAFSTAAAIVGLRSFAELARRAHDEQARAEVLENVSLLEKGFKAAFIRDGKLHGTLEEGIKNDIDGALLAAINFGIVTDPAVVQDTIERMELLKVASGGYRRVRCILTDPSIFEYWYERQEFLFVDFSLAEIYRRQGSKAKADAMLERIVDKAAADHNHVPEMYVAESCQLFPGNIGDPTGAIPMVGYGAAVYILQSLQ